jgi:hypothetical protein
MVLIESSQNETVVDTAKNRENSDMKRKPVRNRRMNSKKRPNRRTRKDRRAPRTAEQLAVRPERFKSVWDRIIGVVSKMRGEKVSLEKASRESGVSPRTVKRWAGSALQKSSSGKWSPNKDDTLLRVLIVQTPEGRREIGVLGFRKASLIGEYSNAVSKYLQTGDASGLKRFRGKKIRAADGEQISLLTDLAELNRRGSAGVLSFESLYARST